MSYRGVAKENHKSRECGRNRQIDLDRRASVAEQDECSFCLSLVRNDGVQRCGYCQEFGCVNCVKSGVCAPCADIWRDTAIDMDDLFHESVEEELRVTVECLT